MYVWERSVGRCLSIVQLPRHHPVVGRSLIHRSDPLTWPRATISVTLGALLSRLVRTTHHNTPSLTNAATPKTMPCIMSTIWA